MNKIQVLGNKIFNGIDLPIIEGGFTKGSRTILVKTVAEIHGTTLKRVNELINDNIEEFEFGIDMLDLKNSVGNNDSLLELGFSKQSISNSKNIYLLSEQGYMALVSLMRTSKSKEIRKQLRREYFAMREQLRQIQDSYLISDPIERAKAWIKEQEKFLEVKKEKEILQLENAEMKPKVVYHDEVLNSDKLITMTDVAKDLGMSARTLNKTLNELRVIYKKGTIWKVYSHYQFLMDENYLDYHITEYSQTLKATEKGRKWIIEFLDDRRVRCRKCNNIVYSKDKIKVGVSVNCKCGVKMTCIEHEEDWVKWRETKVNK